MDAAEESRGLIFNIQRYSIHDGPGIRTLVFMKGCPLRCIWCSNPEGVFHGKDILAQPDRCMGCGACAAACSREAIRPRPCPRGRVRCMGCGSCNPMPGVGDDYEIDRKACDRCGRCALVCPTNAKSLFGSWETVEGVVGRIKRDAAFYRHSGGGVTMGGGEVLMQPCFVLGVLRRCKAEGLNTAIETCGQGDWAWLDAIAGYCDTIYYDLKAADPFLHVRLTGQGNERILENLRLLDERLRHTPQTALIVRMPLVAGCNDSDADMDRAADFITKNLSVYRHVELLPFHNMGEQKYRQLGLTYPFAGRPNAPRGAFDRCARRLRERGISTVVSNW